MALYLNGVYQIIQTIAKTFTQHNVFSKKVNLTQISLQLFQTQVSIFKNVPKYVWVRQNREVLCIMLDIRNKLIYDSCREVAQSLAICDMVLFVVIVKCPSIPQKSPSQMFQGSYRKTNSRGGNSIAYSSIVLFQIKI